MPDADELTGEIPDANETIGDFNNDLLRAEIDFGTTIVVQQCVDFLRDRIDRLKQLAKELAAVSEGETPSITLAGDDAGILAVAATLSDIVLMTHGEIP